MSNKKYAAEKPEDCSLCFFWKNARQGCSLGKENCYFIIFEPEKEKSAVMDALTDEYIPVLDGVQNR